MDERVKGIVISSKDYKDNDKLLTLFTLEKGIVFAKIVGVKKPNAKLKAVKELFCFAEFDLARKGDFLTIQDNGARKLLQDYLVNEKVPRSERDRLIVLADGSHILWIPGMRISSYYKVSKQTKKIFEIYIGGEDNGGKN